MNSTWQLSANPVTGFTTGGQLHYSSKNIFLQIWLTFLFAFISLKHNKLQMIQWGYHNCYGNLELSADFWLKTKNGFIDNTATDEKKNLERLGLREQRLISDINIHGNNLAA